MSWTAWGKHNKHVGSKNDRHLKYPKNEMSMAVDGTLFLIEK